MTATKQQVKMLVSGLTIAAALTFFVIGGTTNAQETQNVVNGDNVTIVSNDNNWASNKFQVGAILAGKTTTDTPTPTTTTVWQESTGAHMITGVDDVEFSPAYKWAREFAITTVPYSSARLDAPILRYEFVKMMLAYIQNVEGKTLEKNTQCDASKYRDYKTMDASVKIIVQQGCELGLMGWKSVVGLNQTVTTPLDKFRPYDIMTEGEVVIVANRYVPTTIRLTPTNNTRSAVIRFLYSMSPEDSDEK